MAECLIINQIKNLKLLSLVAGKSHV